MTSRAIAHHSVAETARPMPEVASEHGEDHEHALESTDLARIAFVAGAAAAVWFGIWEPIHQVSVIGVIGLLVGGWPILNEAFENILARRMTMELSMTIAIVAAAAIGEFFTALVITLFVLIAEVLEGMTVSRGRRPSPARARAPASSMATLVLKLVAAPPIGTSMQLHGL